MHAAFMRQRNCMLMCFSNIKTLLLPSKIERKNLNNNEDLHGENFTTLLCVHVWHTKCPVV